MTLIVNFKLWSGYFRTLHRVFLRKERRKLIRVVHGKTKHILNQFPELGVDQEFIKSYFENKVGYKPPKPYHEIIRRPLPDEVSSELKKRLQGDSNKKFYDDDF